MSPSEQTSSHNAHVGKGMKSDSSAEGAELGISDSNPHMGDRII